MTEEEGLKELCRRAANRNLYFSGHGRGHPIGARIETVGGEEIYDLYELFGGKIGGMERQRPSWVIHDEAAEDLIRRLLPRNDFKRSGKFRFAVEVLSASTGIPLIEIIERYHESN